MSSAMTTAAAPGAASPSLEQIALDLSPSIYRVALSILRDNALAEDAVQETLIRVWTNIARFRGDSSLRVWVLRIAHNVSINLARKRRDHLTDPSTLDDAGPSVSGPDRALEQRHAMAKLWQLLDGLDETTRAIVVLREVEHLSYEEISETLGVPLPSVKTRLFRARRHLASRLEGWR